MKATLQVGAGVCLFAVLRYCAPLAFGHVQATGQGVQFANELCREMNNKGISLKEAADVLTQRYGKNHGKWDYDKRNSVQLWTSFRDQLNECSGIDLTSWLKRKNLL